MVDGSDFEYFNCLFLMFHSVLLGSTQVDLMSIPSQVSSDLVARDLVFPKSKITVETEEISALGQYQGE